MIWIAVHQSDDTIQFVEPFASREDAKAFVLKQIEQDGWSGFDHYPSVNEGGGVPSVEQWCVGQGSDYCIYPRSIR